MNNAVDSVIAQPTLERNSETRLASWWSGWWFAFFVVLYVIVLIKVMGGNYINDGLFFGIYSIAITFYVLSRFLLSYFHAPVYADPSYEPTISFVVPAKNEEDNIYETIQRFAEVNYPLKKIEVIAINDGSTDRTYEMMLQAAESIRTTIARVEVVNFEVNLGKRHGMAEGVKRARNDIIIFIDSDSFVEKDCVRELVKYFVQPQIGAVSGHTDVHNKDTNLLTQMQTLRYYVSFRVYKAAESIFGIVTCCPGCCSAYRREYLLEFIDEWLHQKFLGRECTFGDDRSLTNYMLRKYDATYNPDAKAVTVVPDTFGKYMRQQQRWKKSWVRETMIAATFIWRKNKFAALFFYIYLFLAFSSPIVFLHAMVWNPFLSGIMPFVYLFGLFIMLALHGLYYRAHRRGEPWLWPVATFWFYTVVLMWQLPWAVITIADTKWGTR